MRIIQNGQVKNTRKHLKNLLRYGRLDLEQLDPTIYQSAQCEMVLKYIQKYWLNLTVFADFPKYSLDDEKMVVDVKRVKKGHLPTASLLLNISTQAIFIIDKHKDISEDGSISEQGLLNMKPHRGKIEIIEEHIATPSVCQENSRIDDVVEFIFDEDFSESLAALNLRNHVEKNGLRGLALQRLVKLAVKHFNMRFDHETASSHFGIWIFNQFWQSALGSIVRSVVSAGDAS